MRLRPVTFAPVLLAAALASAPARSAEASNAAITWQTLRIPSDHGLVNPRAIATGADGALWFTDDVGGPGPSGIVWRSTVTGAMSAFPLPVAHANPLGITSGPDG